MIPTCMDLSLDIFLTPPTKNTGTQKQNGDPQKIIIIDITCVLFHVITQWARSSNNDPKWRRHVENEPKEEKVDLFSLDTNINK